MANTAYSEKLRSPKWQKRRLEILSRDNFTCKLCGDEETELHIHHEKYVGEPWEAPVEFLKTACKDCHSISHILSKEGITIVKCIKVKSASEDIMNLICNDDQGNTYFFQLRQDSPVFIVSFIKNSPSAKAIYVLNTK